MRGGHVECPGDERGRPAIKGNRKSVFRVSDFFWRESGPDEVEGLFDFGFEVPGF